MYHKACKGVTEECGTIDCENVLEWHCLDSRVL